jgi:hypothetical protein
MNELVQRDLQLLTLISKIDITERIDISSRALSDTAVATSV